jgi:ParB family chromosome partitioning protein
MSKSTPNKDLIGKGLRSLLQNMDADFKNPAGKVQPAAIEKAIAINRIALTNIIVNPKNPRKDFDEKALQELAQSLKMHDLIQPITVAQLTNGKFQLIAGERRFRAAKIAGLTDVPAYIRLGNDKELLELALLENLQRVDLNEIEVALSYQRMMDELNYTQEQVAERMGKDRSTVSNYIRLLELPPAIQAALRNGSLSVSLAKLLIGKEVDKQLFLLKEIIEKGLTVRQTEALIKNLTPAAGSKNTSNTSHPNQLSPVYQRLENKLKDHFGTQVQLQHQKNGSGKITISYNDLNALVYGVLAVPVATYVYNNDLYTKTKFAYEARIQEANGDNSNVIKIDPTLKNLSAGSLQSYRNIFRKNRDYSIMWFILAWGINVVDASVSGHLKEFDVSNNLTMKMAPMRSDAFQQAGLSLQFNWKYTK